VIATVVGRFPIRNYPRVEISIRTKAATEKKQI